MRLLSLLRRKASPVPSGGWVPFVRESFTGAWQRNIEVDKHESLLAFSAVYACVSLVASDISKLRIRVMADSGGDNWSEVTRATALAEILRYPNQYQTRQQFIEQWMISRLLYGNAYMLIERDWRRLPTAIYPLHPRSVTPLVSEDGAVFYRLQPDNLSGISAEITVPQRDIIHDRGACLWHPLVGVSPIQACGRSATVGNRIQANSGLFFENMSRPSGILTAPGEIKNDTAARLKEHWETNFSGSNIGRVAVLGDGLKYEAMTIPASDAQLIEQLKWTVEDVARCFHVPLHKIGAVQPTYNNVEALNTAYYSDCLQALIESIEACLDRALGLPPNMATAFDIEGLLRMDTATQGQALAGLVGAGIMAPNEARAKLGLPPAAGGDTPYLQQQNYSLAALDARERAPE
ncbi:MAG: phage portal protein [Burkholderiaceae bacterium]